MIWIRKNDPRSMGSWYIKGTDEAITGEAFLMLNKRINLVSLIPKKRSLSER